MIEVLKFIFKCTTDFLKMLFTIDVGSGLNLGVVMCVIFIFLPLVLTIINFFKVTVMEEYDEHYDLRKVFGLGEKKYQGRHEFLGKHSCSPVRSDSDYSPKHEFLGKHGGSLVRSYSDYSPRHGIKGRHGRY